jgi:hypothetical protein
MAFLSHTDVICCLNAIASHAPFRSVPFYL